MAAIGHVCVHTVQTQDAQHATFYPTFIVAKISETERYEGSTGLHWPTVSWFPAGYMEDTNALLK